ncbi:hypothetical protein Holit_01763 [Hollandina sp. SP2]
MRRTDAVQTRRIPIKNKKAKIALIHVAKKSIGITDEDYCALLIGAAGIDSTKYLEYEYQFDEIMKIFNRLGFVSRKKESSSISRHQWTDKWGCTDAQRAKIEAMWRSCARNPSDRALRAFVKRITHVDHPSFLRPTLAGKVINALSAMMVKAGYDPEIGRRPVL